MTPTHRQGHPEPGGGMKRFSGIYTPIATPFGGDGSVDERALAANVSRWMTTPLTGLVVLGSNGEATSLDDDEADRVVDVVRAGVPSSRPVMAGTGRESTRATMAATRRAAAAGVDAALVRTPAFFKPQMTSDAFVRHFTEVADASPIPVLLYNVTLYTGVNLLPDAVERLAIHPNIVGIKESGSDIGQIAEYVARTPEDFTVLAGSATTLVHALCAGCDGAILALASLMPAECVSMMTLIREKQLDEATALQRRLMPLARSIGSTYGVPGLKAALELIGYVGGSPRPPLRPVSSEVVDIIRRQLAVLNAAGNHVPALR
jgi:4-hydroxy-tetrahydrodipicolinate synthase